MERRMLRGARGWLEVASCHFAGVLLALSGCSNARTAPASMPPVEVGIVTIQPQAITLTAELPGRTLASETSEVRPQVSGIIRERAFVEGQMVRAGQTLYQIDARLYQAARAEAEASLASARAQSEAARAKAERYALLSREQVISDQDNADVQASALQAAAAVQQARAALETARINLQFTRVPAPIAGRIGRSSVTTGALVTAGQPEPLATIQRLDPILVDMQESSANLLEMRRTLARGGRAAASADVRLKLEDGGEYAETGRLQFAEAMVDPSTGSVTLRARFGNPEGVLLPGMYVRAIVVQAEREAAILAPQPGITRDPKGKATALVVGAGDKVEQREVEVERTLNDQWIVNSGLGAGDRLIVEGTDKVRAGQVIKPVAAGDAEHAQAVDARAPAARP